MKTLMSLLIGIVLGIAGTVVYLASDVQHPPAYPTIEQLMYTPVY